MAGKTILEVQNLTKFFNTPGGQLHAVDGVSFTIEEGRTLGIVGESGCGKSTTGRTILKLLEPTGGKILFDGQDITGYSRKQMRPLRQEDADGISGSLLFTGSAADRNAAHQ